MGPERIPERIFVAFAIAGGAFSVALMIMLLFADF
jgi:hypothetical protein